MKSQAYPIREDRAASSMGLEQAAGRVRDVAVQAAPRAGFEVVTHEDVGVGPVAPGFSRIEIHVGHGSARGGEDRYGHGYGHEYRLHKYRSLSHIGASRGFPG